MTKQKQICFVCLGNIVRSPLAQHMFNQVVKEAGLAHKYKAVSAGTSGWHVGEPPDARMRRVAARYGLTYDGSARQFKRQDFESCELVIAMDTENRAFLLSSARSSQDKAKIRLLREFDPHGGPNSSVPDPYYGGA
jgi:protein-tyrosine phosphatase